MFCGETSRWTTPSGRPVGVGRARARSRARCAACAIRYAVAPGVSGLARGRLAQHRGQRLALHQLHHEEVLVAVVADLDDADDVGMIEQRGDARLVEEHADELRVGREVRQDALDDDQCAKSRHVAGQRQIDLRHAPCRQAADDLVPPEALDRVVAPRGAKLGARTAGHRPLQSAAARLKGSSFVSLRRNSWRTYARKSHISRQRHSCRQLAKRARCYTAATTDLLLPGKLKVSLRVFAECVVGGRSSVAPVAPA